MAAPSKRELIDLVDHNDHVIGQITRGQALHPGTAFRVVHVLAVNDRDEVVLQRIGGGGTRHPGQWGSSVAGYLHAGESPLAGARRRMAEEIGLDSALSFLGRTQMTDSGAHKFIYVYMTRVDRLPRIYDEAHVAELRFWSLQAIADAEKKGSDVFTKTFAFVLKLAQPYLSAD